MRKVVCTNIWNSLPINVPSAKRGCFEEILEARYQQMRAFLSHHSRMFYIRLDIRINEYTPDNKLISDFMRKFIKRLKRHYKLTRVGYCWVREIEKAKQQHYHLELYLDGHKVRGFKYVVKIAQEIASGWDWPSPWQPKNCYTKVINEDDFKKAFYRGSYLAKTRGKNYKGKTSRNFGSSQIRCVEVNDAL